MSNWPHNTDLSHSNWTGRTQRESKKYGSYSDAKIPFDGFILMGLVLFAVFGFLPLLYWVLK